MALKKECQNQSSMSAKDGGICSEAIDQPFVIHYQNYLASQGKLPLQKARPEFHGRVRSLASALPHMRHPQGISIHFTHHHTNSREPWVGKSSVFCIRGPEHPRGQVHLPGSESHSPSSAKDGEAVHCPLSQGICMLRRIITSAKGKAPQHRLSGLSRKGRLYQ